MGQPDNAPQGMMVWIRTAAKQMRQEHDANTTWIAAQHRDRICLWTVHRFERGESTNIDIDAMIAAYSAGTGVPEIEFWRRALKLREAHNPAR